MESGKLMTTQEQNDYVAAKMGIIFLCENCRHRVRSISDKLGNIIGWIHTESESVICDSTGGKQTTAFPASLQTLTEMYEVPKNKTYQGKNKINKVYVDLIKEFNSDYSLFKNEYDN